MILHPNIIIVGIGGCSRSGKTTLTKELIDQFNNISNINSEFTKISSSLHLDRYFNIKKIRNNIIKTNFGNFQGHLIGIIFFQILKKQLKK